jgi:hypothetical protein
VREGLATGKGWNLGGELVHFRGHDFIDAVGGDDGGGDAGVEFGPGAAWE